MSTDSQAGGLPLADAILAWSDPILINAIRAEEAKVPQHLLDSLGRYTLDSIRAQRTKPSRRPLFASPTGVESLDRAWEKLFGTFRLKVEKGQYSLSG